MNSSGQRSVLLPASACSGWGAGVVGYRVPGYRVCVPGTGYWVVGTGTGCGGSLARSLLSVP